MGDLIQFDKLKNVVVPWTESKKDFLLSIDHSEWIITDKNELYYLVNSDSENYNVKESFLMVERAAYHTTDWIRLYFAENHPEIDFDKKFKTDKPGVFDRVYSDFNRDDIDQWRQNAIYGRLVNELAKLGYKIEWTEKEK